MEPVFLNTATDHLKRSLGKVCAFQSWQVQAVNVTQSAGCGMGLSSRCANHCFKVSCSRINIALSQNI